MATVKFLSNDSSLLDGLMDSSLFYYCWYLLILFHSSCPFLVRMTSYSALHPGYCYYEILRFFADRTYWLFSMMLVVNIHNQLSCWAPQHCSTKSGVTLPLGIGEVTVQLSPPSTVNFLVKLEHWLTHSYWFLCGNIRSVPWHTSLISWNGKWVLIHIRLLASKEEDWGQAMVWSLETLFPSSFFLF